MSMTFKLEQRISIEGQRATIKYIGRVDTADTYLGIEWDDPTRGKHSGSINSIEYFKTTLQNAGSFVNSNSRKIVRQKDFLEVLRGKYQQQDLQGDSKIQFGGTSISVETCGWEKIHQKQSNLQSLECVGLMDMGIGGRLNRTDSIRDTCGNIQDLDLSKNLFSSWGDVASITIELMHLTSLRLNHTRFKKYTLIPKELQGAFNGLKVLSLNFTLIAWECIARLEHLLPNLTELHLRNNHLSTIPESISGLNRLLLLNLEGNCFTNWKDIQSLSKLKSLTTLCLNDNKISNIGLIDPFDFVSLKAIHLNNNLVSDWTSINNLNHLSQVNEIRIKNNPIIDMVDNDNQETRHFKLIARLNNRVVYLNGSEISVKRRRDAEIYYLNKCAAIRAVMDEVQFGLLHPRYKEIVEVYGEPEIALKQTASRTVKDGLIEIKFKCAEHENVKGIPRHTKIRVLKSIVRRLFKGVNVVGLECDGAELSDDMRELQYYDIVNGSEIRVIL